MSDRFHFTVRGQIIKDKPITELNLGTRAKNVLQRSHIYTLSQLTDCWDSIGSLKGMGTLTTKEIRAAFFKWYIEAIENTPEWTSFIDSLEVIDNEAFFA